MFFQLHAETTWPLDNPEEVSIGRAVQIVGKIRFGEDWDRIVAASSIPFIPGLPKQSLASRQDCEVAWSFLPDSSQRRKPPTITNSSGGTRIFLTPENWQQAEIAIKERQASQLRDFASFASVPLSIREQCLTGRLCAYAQIYNGNTIPINAALWKTERFQRWFDTGKASMLEVVDQPFSGDEPSLWVFFKRDQLLQAFPETMEMDEHKGEPTAYSQQKVEEWLASYWKQFDGDTLHTFSDGKQRAYPRFDADFKPAINEAFPNISSGIVRRAWDQRPLGNRRVRE